MSLDGQAQVVSRKIKNNRPIKHEWQCECGGTVYASPSSRYVVCSNGEIRCTMCRREARRFGRRGITCGFGCVPYGRV